MLADGRLGAGPGLRDRHDRIGWRGVGVAGKSAVSPAGDDERVKSGMEEFMAQFITDQDLYFGINDQG
jgi:hypothetical protein